jgi:NADP-dependent aldehyde dehydrogenase
MAGITMLNAGLRDSFSKRVASFATLPGVKVLVDGKPSDSARMAPVLLETTPQDWIRQRALHEEAFGPGALLIQCDDVDAALDALQSVGGSLTGTLQAGSADSTEVCARVLRELQSLAGRVLVNGYPTGVEVNRAIVHGGPYPATTDPASTSVGSAAVRRFMRLIAYQDVPDNLLPPALQNDNPLKINRLVDGQLSRAAISVGAGASR